MGKYWTRRDFIHSAGLASAMLATGGLAFGSAVAPAVDKRQVMLDLLDADKKQDYIPAGFFLHFDKAYYQGPQAVEMHLAFFRATGMDFVKVNYENRFPAIPAIQKPSDWAKMPLYGEDFYAPQLELVEALVKANKGEALVLCTLYSPFMLAAQTAGKERVTEHIKENPAQVNKGMEIITESLLKYIRACVSLGVDGFYHSTQGGESGRFDGWGPFNECIKPFDLAAMEEIDRTCIFNILHVCDHYGDYDDLATFLDYPGHVVNCALKVGGRAITPAEASAMFGRPFMGGMQRTGTIATGSQQDIRTAAQEALGMASDKFILGADCTVPGDTSWDNLRTAIDTAHAWRRA